MPAQVLSAKIEFAVLVLAMLWQHYASKQSAEGLPKVHFERVAEAFFLTNALELCFEEWELPPALQLSKLLQLPALIV